MSRPSFDRDDICKDCGVHRSKHGLTHMVGEKGTEYILRHCPDLSLPQHVDDDPWSEKIESEPQIAELFDPYQ